MSTITTLVKIAALGAMVSAAFYGEATATPTPFTWDPSAVGLNGGFIVNANNLNVADFASIAVNTNTGIFTETGALNILNFLNDGNTIFSTGLGSTYSLYLTFNGTGTLSGIPSTLGASSNGSLDSFTYELIGSTSASPPLSFSVSNGSVTVNDPGIKTILAYGNLVQDTGFLTVTKTANGFSPTENLNLTFNECFAAGQDGVCTANNSPFFVSPLFPSLELSVLNFSATDTITTLNLVGSTEFINMIGGGGNQTFQNGPIPNGGGGLQGAPEPASLAMLGSALIGFAAMRRRRSV